MEYFIIGGLVLILLELIVGIQTGFDLVLIGSILIISGLLGQLFDNSNLALILTVLLSAVYILVGRKAIKRNLSITTKTTNIDRLIGKTGLVIKNITNKKTGSIQIDDEVWRASSSENIKVNQEVQVTAVEGVTLQVKRI